MDTLEAISSRRNVRQFQDRPIPDSDLDAILEAARRTPSSRNEQRWDFVVVTEPDRLSRLSRVWRGAGHVARSAATIALIAPISDDHRVRESVQYDLGQVTMSIALAATAFGVGTGHAAVAEHSLAREILEHPEERFCAWLIAFGYPADRPLTPVRRPTRRPFDEVVHRETW